MPELICHVALPAESAFQMLPGHYTFTRVPCKGEYVGLGNDDDGIAADYEVVFVHHQPLRSSGADAEIFLVRRFFPDALPDEYLALEPQGVPWKAGRLPHSRIDDE